MKRAIGNIPVLLSNENFAYIPMILPQARSFSRLLTFFPEFRGWLKEGFLNGYGIGEKEPWTRFAREGYF